MAKLLPLSYSGQRFLSALSNILVEPTNKSKNKSAMKSAINSCHKKHSDYIYRKHFTTVDEQDYLHKMYNMLLYKTYIKNGLGRDKHYQHNSAGKGVRNDRVAD
ncbi:hypothetical protein EDC56_1666 [Sinobacterium caligoides]|uniref:Uncharacterized protein n=1 Tax=Sinobacterium caligoides TaxID=933926 RepID=A0A3N2DN46_9GAMM|nr:hypothetical protein EDC56_1666 [Sinobacterium caligoides]